MNILEKLRIIEEKVPKEGADVVSSGTSIHITHLCGCLLVEHHAPGRPYAREEGEDLDKFRLLMAERRYFVELCKEHQNVRLPEK